MWQREEEFKGVLKKAVTNASKSCIEQLTDLAVADETWCYKHVCALVEKQMAKAAVKHRKNVVYVMSSICRQSKARLGSKDKYGQRFELMLPRCAMLLGDASRDDLAQVEKVVRSWRKETIFSPDALSTFEGALEQAAITAMADRPRQQQQEPEVIAGPAASPEAPAPDMDFDPGHTFEDDGATTQPPTFPSALPATSRGGWGTDAAAAAGQALHGPPAVDVRSNGQLPPPPMEAPWDRLAKKARGSRWGAPMPSGGPTPASQPGSEPCLPPPPALGPPAASAAHHPAVPAPQSWSLPLSAPSPAPAPVPPQPRPSSAQQPGLLPPAPTAPPAPPVPPQNEASEGLKRALAIAARLTRSGSGQAPAQQAGSASLPPAPAIPSSGSHAPATSAGHPMRAPQPPQAPPLPAAPVLGRSNSIGASFPSGRVPPGLSAPEETAPRGPGDAGSLLLSMLGPPAPRNPGPPPLPPGPRSGAGNGVGQGGSSSDERAPQMPPQLSAIFAPTRPMPPSQPPPSYQAWQGAQPRPPPTMNPLPLAMNPLPPAPGGHAQYGALPGGWAAHPQLQAGGPLPWNGLHHGQQLPGAGKPPPWLGQPRPHPPIPFPAPPPGNPGAVGGHRAPPPPPAAAPPAPPADPHIAQHHAAEDDIAPPPPPGEPSAARASESKAAGSTQPGEAAGEAGAAAGVPTTVNSVAPPPPPQALALPAGAADGRPGQAAHLGPLGAVQPLTALREVATGGKALHTAQLHAPLPNAHAANGHATGTGNAATVQVSSVNHCSALDDVWSAAAAVLPDIAALQSPQATWRHTA